MQLAYEFKLLFPESTFDIIIIKHNTFDMENTISHFTSYTSYTDHYEKLRIFIILLIKCLDIINIYFYD